MISGVLIGDRALVARFRALPDALRARLDATTMRLGYMLQAKVQQSYLTGQVFRVRTGRLRSSISPSSGDSRSRFVGTSTSSVYYVGTNVSYAKPLFYGHAAYTVKPLRAKALHFTIGGRSVFAKSANIPAKPGKNVLVYALNEMRPVIVREYQQTLHDTAVAVLRK